MSNQLGAARHHPIAHGRVSRGAGEARQRAPEPVATRRTSVMRLQAAVVVERKKKDDVDPYADVPCTD